jgi:hypothetical protein
MANITRNFIKGRMNKSVDERLIPDGEYVDAINVRMGSTEQSEIGVIENAKGNIALTTISYDGVPLSTSAKCIGAFEDGSNETIYWFIHDSDYPVSAGAPTGKLDLIVSFDVQDGIIKHHLVSVNDDSNSATTLNFDPRYLITGVDKVSDLLFFTDNKNAPRFINVKSSFSAPNSTGVDYGGNPDILAERLLVIKKPPLYAPTIDLRTLPNIENNYLEDRQICFSYRYRYADGECSATSPFSDSAFLPKVFNFSINSLLNEGMINQYNAVVVGYNTGGPLVKSIELLFKNAQDSTIKVIDKINKKDSGLSDNSTETYLFDNSNIFTILPFSEILRMYDNVPRFALGQTIMGNRLIYGNYIDGYNLQRNGFDTQVEYTVDLISIGAASDILGGTIVTGNYNIASRGINVTCNNTSTIDLSSIKDKLKKGSVLTIDLSFQHNTFQGPNIPTIQTPSTNIVVSFTMPKDYTSVYELCTSVEFIDSIGNASPKNINPVNAPTGDVACNGVTFTDDFNCNIPNTLTTSTGSVEKFASAVNGDSLVGALAYNDNQPISITVVPSGISVDILFIKIPYMRFVEDATLGGDTSNDVYEFYDLTFTSGSFQSTSTLGSLHSNRGYEIAMVYMDDFGRSSTALVSPNNALQVPCSASENKNSIKVTIPPRQLGPEWATHYKFAIKPDEENYDVIYSNVYYQKDIDASYYFLLEGENSRKVEEGDRLIVKRDSSGVRGGCVYATVLEKVSFATDELQAGSLPGAYMKMSSNAINATEDINAYFPMEAFVFSSDTCAAKLFLLEDRSQQFGEVSIPAGSVFAIETLNATANIDANCFDCPQREVYVSNIRIVANRDYINLAQWLDAVDFNTILAENNTGGARIIWKRSEEPCTTFIASIWWQQGNGTTTASAIGVRSFPAGGSRQKRRSRLDVKMSLTRTESTIIFETEPQDALPDVWFESADTYSIDPITGYHEGNEQTQTSTLPAIVNTDFYNCFSFGNGAESYKIRDSIVGRTFNLGNRVLTTSEKEYREAHRYADLTYSGVFNEENNVNKLNEFNLGLLNFKSLEQLFGPVQKLVGRETDILVLQEDKISYVLQGKNLLSDAGAGTALTSVPEVLGTQIARIEKYGISNNPESFVQWGADKYFTDAKRGAVIQLKGSSAQNEQLNVISEQGMRSWFRDLFIDSFQTQKLGGFDPYMDEYVISSNNTLKPVEEGCIDCGTFVGDIIVTELTPYEFCVDVGTLVGDLTISIEVIDIETIPPNAQFDVTYTYAGISTTYVSNNPPTSGVVTIVIDKNSVSDQKVTVVVSNYGLDESFVKSITVGCPVADIITIIPISVTSNANNGEYIHSEYSWTDGTFISPLHSRLVEFKSDTISNPIVSDYDIIVGPQGAGIIPADGAIVSLVCNKINFDDFIFEDNTNNFRYLRSNTFYDENIEADMQALLAAATIATPIVNSPPTYSASFAMPSTGSYLYLIWDYRISTEDDLCFGATLADSCCNC